MNSKKEKPLTFHLKIRFLTGEQLDVYGVLRFSVDQDMKSGDIRHIQWTFVNGNSQSVDSLNKGGIKSFVVKQEKKNGSNR